MFVSYIIYRPNVQAMGVYDEFCLVEVLQPNTNLLTSCEYVTYIPIVAACLLGQGPVEISGHAKY